MVGDFVVNQDFFGKNYVFKKRTRKRIMVNVTNLGNAVYINYIRLVFNYGIKNL